MAAESMLFGERRQFIRKDCLRLVDIQEGSKLYIGHMRDLALGGAYVECDEVRRALIGKELFLFIPFELRDGIVRVHAEVARIQFKGMGLRFLDINRRRNLHL